MPVFMTGLQFVNCVEVDSFDPPLAIAAGAPRSDDIGRNHSKTHKSSGKRWKKHNESIGLSRTPGWARCADQPTGPSSLVANAQVATLGRTDRNQLHSGFVATSKRNSRIPR